MKYKLSLGFSILAACCIQVPRLVAAAPEELSARENPKEILETGRKGDKSNIEKLRKLKMGKDKSPHGTATSAQMALAKLGEKKEMDEILNEAKEGDPEVKSNAIEKLGYVADKTAIRALVAQLDDTTKYKRKHWLGPDGKSHSGHVIYLPPSFKAMKTLADIVPNGPHFNKEMPTEDDIQKWKEWWKNNKQKYE